MSMSSPFQGDDHTVLQEPGSPRIFTSSPIERRGVAEESNIESQEIIAHNSEQRTELRSLRDLEEQAIAILIQPRVPYGFCDPSSVEACDPGFSSDSKNSILESSETGPDRD